MKCNKCGQSVNKNDDFCINCGAKIKKEIIEKDTNSNKKIFFILLVEIILVILMALGVNCYYAKYFSDQYATQNEFKDFVNNKNYILDDVTENYSNQNVKSYDFATINNANLGIHYIVADSDRSATNVFYNLHRQIESQKQSGPMNTYSVDFMNYNYYSLENNGNYYVVVKNNDTVFAATGLSEYKEEINEMVEELGFGYPSSIIYIILGTITFVFVLMYFVMWKIFVKAGRKGWHALIPFYNCYCLSKIAFNKGWYFIFMLITPINIIFILIMCYKIAKVFGKSTVFAVCSIFFPYITMQIIAFDNSRYIGNKKEQ